MVTRVRPLPSVVGRHDGPADLWETPCVCAEAAVHRGVFREYWADAVFLARGKFKFMSIVIAFRVCCSREWVGGETIRGYQLTGVFLEYSLKAHS